MQYPSDVRRYWPTGIYALKWTTSLLLFRLDVEGVSHSSKITTHIPIQDEAWLPSRFGHDKLCGGCGHFSTTLHSPRRTEKAAALFPEESTLLSTSGSSKLCSVVYSGQTWALSESKRMLGTTLSEVGSAAMAAARLLRAGSLLSLR